MIKTHCEQHIKAEILVFFYTLILGGIYFFQILQLIENADSRSRAGLRRCGARLETFLCGPSFTAKVCRVLGIQTKFIVDFMSLL